MFDVVDTAFSYGQESIVCSFLQDFYKGKGSSYQLLCNAHTACLLCGQNESNACWEELDVFSSNLIGYCNLQITMIQLDVLLTIIFKLPW